MENINEVNMNLLSDVDDGKWLSAGSSCSDDFEFDPNSYFNFNSDLDNVNILPTNIHEAVVFDNQDLCNPILIPSNLTNAISEARPKQNGGKRKSSPSQRDPSSITSDEEEAFVGASNMYNKLGVRRNGGKKPAVSPKPNPSCNNSDDDEAYGCQPNKSKNAIAARENRLKKKRYVEGLEKSVNSLASKNNQLVSKVDDLEEQNRQLRDEVEYLRNVLANSDDIAILINSIKTANKAKSQCNFDHCLKQHDYSKSPETEVAQVTTRSSSKRKIEKSSEDQENNFKKPKNSGNNRAALGGVCLHVNNGKLALECCVQCSVSAYKKGLQ